MKTIILFGLVLGALSAAGKVYIAGVGDTVTLECGVNNVNSRLDWSHHELILRFQTNGLSTKGSSPIKLRAKKKGETGMEISNVMESDSGKFTCAAGGSVHEHHLIVVSVSVVPSETVKVGADATLECKANSGVSGHLNPKIKWQEPDGSVQTKPKVELKLTSSHKGAWQCIVSHQEESFTKTVVMNVEVVPTTPTLIKNPKSSDIGNGKNSTAVGGSGHPILLLGLVWWIWAAIGAGGLVVIILIIVIIVMNKRNKRKKKKFLRMKKTQLSQKPKKYCQCVRQTAAAKPQQGRRREKPPALPRQPLLRE